jgi:hypothetical protein
VSEPYGEEAASEGPLDPGGLDEGRHRRQPGSGTDFGIEDVLHNPPAGPVTKHSVKTSARRSPWNRQRDRVIAAVIFVVVLAAGLLGWATSETRATTDALSPAAPAAPPAPPAVPGSMTRIWQFPSRATPVPIADGNNVVTADNGEVAGRDPLTGQIRWHYSRDLPLCTVDSAWSRVNAVYAKTGVDGQGGCSEVTQLDPATGRRTAQRNGDAEFGTQLVGDGTYVTTTGKKLLDTWRNDLVETMEYGTVVATVQPGRQPRTGCTYGSVAASGGKIGVIERCAGDPADRLTVYNATADDSDNPKVVFSSIVAGKSAKLVAMSGDNSAVALPDKKLLVIYGPDGNQKAAYPLDLPASDLAQDPASGVMTTSRTADSVYWFTGSKTVALSLDTLTPRWTLNSAVGPGVTFAGQLVIPIKGGLAVLNPADGSTIRTVGVDRGTYTGPVLLNSMGPVLLEQRGGVLAALK